jgi:hypothetical protein
MGSVGGGGVIPGVIGVTLTGLWRQPVAASETASTNVSE